MTLADRVTLARLGLMPVIVVAYLALPPWLGFWVVGWTCALAEYTDLLDGRIARARDEVSDFGKLADPFCDVIYRIGVFLVFLLPAGGTAFAVGPDHLAYADIPGQLVILAADGTAHAGLLPWLPVFLMVLREIVAGALRAMSATKGLVSESLWMLQWATAAAWLCAGLSVISIGEYIWVNLPLLAQLIDRKPLKETPKP